jgi:molybdate transport system ATP-binding protein
MSSHAGLSVAIRKSRGANFILDFQFSIPAGITILFGVSGSGKSTLLDCIAGLARPESGRITLDGRTLFDSAARINLPPARRGVGYLFQSLALFPHISIRQNITYGLARLARAARDARAAAIAESFRIDHLLDRQPNELSGGERQRAALARSLVLEPAALLLDEPLSALDQVVKSAIIRDLRQWNAAHRIPIIYVTHAAEEAYALGERMIAIDAGRIIAQGTPQEVLKTPRNQLMAQLAGFENVFAAEVIAIDEANGTMTCRLDESEVTLEVPLTNGTLHSKTRLAIHAGDIMLAVGRPEGISARNVLAGRVKSILRQGAKVITTIETQGVSFEVHLTPDALHELGLCVGSRAWMILKTYSCHLLEA